MRRLLRNRRLGGQEARAAVPIGRRIAYAVFTGLLVLTTIEIGVRLLFVLFDLDPSAERRRTLEMEREELLGLPNEPSLRGTEVHPFFGYRFLPQAGESSSQTELARYGFPHNRRDRLFFKPSPERIVVAVFGGSMARIAAVGATRTRWGEPNEGGG